MSVLILSTRLTTKVAGFVPSLKLICKTSSTNLLKSETCDVCFDSKIDSISAISNGNFEASALANRVTNLASSADLSFTSSIGNVSIPLFWVSNILNVSSGISEI